MLIITVENIIMIFVITMMTRCSKYWSFLTLASGFGFCTGMWVASETPLIIKTLRWFVCLFVCFLITIVFNFSASPCSHLRLDFSLQVTVIVAVMEKSHQMYSLLKVAIVGRSQLLWKFTKSIPCKRFFLTQLWMFVCTTMKVGDSLLSRGHQLQDCLKTLLLSNKDCDHC